MFKNYKIKNFENALLVLVNAIEKSDEIALVFPDYYYVDTDGQVTGQERRNNFKSEVTLLDQPAHGACTLIRRDSLLEVGGYSPEFTCQDGWDLWLKLTENYSVENVNLPLFYYRKHDTNLTNDTDRLLETRAEIYKSHAKRTNRPNLKVIAIAGSNGKTTTKELVTAVLSTQYKTFSTMGNLNNHLGVPLTILNIS